MDKANDFFLLALPHFVIVHPFFDDGRVEVVSFCRLQPLLALIRSQAMQQQVEALGGYDVSTMGEVIAELP